jgi:hypothetical protein
MTATGLALASARSAFMVTMVIVVVIAMAINATDTLIIVDVGTLGIDSAGLGMVVGIITGGGWHEDPRSQRRTQGFPRQGRRSGPPIAG